MNDLDDAAAGWIRNYAAALDVDPPTDDEIEALLGLAAVAAHASHRQAAPVSCWLAARAGVSMGDAVRIAKDLAAAE